MFTTVLTLICNPARRQLDETVIDNHRQFLSAWSNDGVKVTILADGVAADLFFTIHNTDEAARLIRSLKTNFEGFEIDYAIQPAQGRAKRLLIADMDSTIIEQECIDELAEFVGKRAEISEITERAMRGELDFDAALKERVAMLKGLSIDKLKQAFQERISLTPGARTLIQTMRARGAFTALISGGFTFFTERVAAAAGFHTNQANILLIEGNQLTGAVGTPILGRAAKEEALKHHASEQKIDLADAVAVGDGANDLSMLGAAGLGVAFHAKPAVAAAADVSINYCDLTALLYLQGIPQAEFVH